MRLAWFSASGATRQASVAPSDDTALLVDALRPRHQIDVIDASRAHDFVWQHARNPFDLCVFELGGTAAHHFVSAYAVHFPGLVMLRGLPRYDRALRAARLVVVPHEPVAEAIADDYPGVRVRTLIPGVEPLSDDDEVIVALRWPPDGAALTYALAGFAAARAVIVFDTPETADWPSLDPQTWQLRGLTPNPLLVPGLHAEYAGFDAPPAETWHLRALRGQTPICVSIDPRDEAHSLRLALRRLQQDADLRARLGTAAHAWWRDHATVALAAAGFERLLEEARSLSDPVVADARDGMGLARQILSDFGLSEHDVGFARTR